MSNGMPDVSAELAAIRQQLALVGQQLAGLLEQQKELAALVTNALPRRPEARGTEPTEHTPGPPVREVVARCGQDILRVLREVGRPLTTLEILDELVQRHLSWRESTVSHTLAALRDQGVIRDSGEGGARRHGLVISPGQQGAEAI